MKRINVALDHPRGSITIAIVNFKETDYGFWAEICYPKGAYSEIQVVGKGSNDIHCLFQWDEENGIRNIYAGQITHRDAIVDIETWEEWLNEYVAGTDPRDAFRAYREIVNKA